MDTLLDSLYLSLNIWEIIDLNSLWYWLQYSVQAGYFHWYGFQWKVSIWVVSIIDFNVVSNVEIQFVSYPA